MRDELRQIMNNYGHLEVWALDLGDRKCVGICVLSSITDSNRNILDFVSRKDVCRIARIWVGIDKSHGESILSMRVNEDAR